LLIYYLSEWAFWITSCLGVWLAVRADDEIAVVQSPLWDNFILILSFTQEDMIFNDSATWGITTHFYKPRPHCWWRFTDIYSSGYCNPKWHLIFHTFFCTMVLVLVEAQPQVLASFHFFNKSHFFLASSKVHLISLCPFSKFYKIRCRLMLIDYQTDVIQFNRWGDLYREREDFSFYLCM